ncbi:Rgg/GadR/MutR family transcriptional regulator [Lactococcus lactis]|uniref:Rgg/GadR/MutR family transcriptional regulator n=1 Tax=Lactococcus lactis TaxID=1358 RepID=UPI00223B65D6|nr:Rgg/GadR/MutR family transcriptional regulator [Lactococcus lactis]
MKNTNYGKIFNIIRTSKKISLSELADKDISRSSISQFETGKTILSVDKFFHSLERMNVTNEEFSEIYNYHYLRSFSLYQFSLDLSNAYYQSDIRMLKKILNSLKDGAFFSDLPSQTNHFLQLVVEAYIYRSSNKLPEHCISRTSQLFNYLDRVTIWGLYEFYLASSCACLFNKKQLEKIGNKILPHLAMYNYSSTIYTTALMMLHNMIYSCLTNEFLFLASTFLNYTNSLKLSERSLLTKFCFTYDKGYLLVLLGKKEQGLGLMNQISNIFNLVGETNITKIMEKDILFLKNSK